MIIFTGILTSLQFAISELQSPAWSCLPEPLLLPDTERERVSFCCRVLPCHGVSVLLGQHPLSKTLHTHRGWTESFQSGHASPECDDTKVLPTQVDGSAERACIVSGVSSHYADTFSQSGHFFGATISIQLRCNSRAR